MPNSSSDGPAYPPDDVAGGLDGRRRRRGHQLPARLRTRAISRRDRRHGAPTPVHGRRPDLGRVDGGTRRQPQQPFRTTSGQWNLAVGIEATIGATRPS